ncbi:TRAG protein, partial [human gut metagenome]
YGMHGDASSNFQFAGRELLTPQEVRVLPYEQAILFIKNALPLMTEKLMCFITNLQKTRQFAGMKL